MLDCDGWLLLVPPPHDGEARAVTGGERGVPADDIVHNMSELNSTEVFVPSNKTHYKPGTQQCHNTSWSMIRLLQSLLVPSTYRIIGGWIIFSSSSSHHIHSSNVRTAKLRQNFSGENLIKIPVHIVKLLRKFDEYWKENFFNYVNIYDENSKICW